MTKQTIRTILKALEKNLEKVSEKESKIFIDKINKANKIFIVGAGRSGLVGKSFGMRLMHLGCNVYLVGDTITPAIEEGDILIAISGSGRTSSVKVCVEAAGRKNAARVVITGDSNSDLAKMAQTVIKIPTMIKRVGINDYEARQLKGMDMTTVTPLGTIFELSSMIFCDAIIAELMKKRKISEQEMRRKHNNLE